MSGNCAGNMTDGAGAWRMASTVVWPDPEAHWSELSVKTKVGVLTACL